MRDPAFERLRMSTGGYCTRAYANPCCACVCARARVGVHAWMRHCRFECVGTHAWSCNCERASGCVCTRGWARVRVCACARVRARTGLLAELLVAHELLAKPLDVLGHDLSHHAQPVGRHLDAPEEAVGALEVGGALVLEHRDDARVRHLGERAHVLGDEFAFRHLAQLGVGARVEVVRYALVLLSQPLLRLAHVVGGR
eukprot:494371-Pleurochrysis_carterae.AAC.2